MQPGSVRHKTTLTTPQSKRNASTSPMSQMLIGLPIDRLQGSTTRSRCAISTVVSVACGGAAQSHRGQPVGLIALPYSSLIPILIVMAPSDCNFRLVKNNHLFYSGPIASRCQRKRGCRCRTAYEPCRTAKPGAAHDECSVGTLDLGVRSPLQFNKQMIVWRHA